MYGIMTTCFTLGRVAELVYAQHSKCCSSGIEGSIPSSPTNKKAVYGTDFLLKNACNKHPLLVVMIVFDVIVMRVFRVVDVGMGVAVESSDGETDDNETDEEGEGFFEGDFAVFFLVNSRDDVGGGDVDEEAGDDAEERRKVDTCGIADEIKYNC